MQNIHHYSNHGDGSPGAGAPDSAGRHEVAALERAEAEHDRRGRRAARTRAALLSALGQEFQEVLEAEARDDADHRDAFLASTPDEVRLGPGASQDEDEEGGPDGR